MELFIVAVIGVILFFFGGMALQALSKARRKEVLESKIKALSEYNLSKFFIGEDGRSAIGLDEKEGNILIMTGGPLFRTQLIHFSDLVSSEIFAEESDKADHVGGLQLVIIARAAYLQEGGPAGGEGEERYTVSFLVEESRVGSFSHNMAMHKANHWFELTDGLIKRADKAEESKLADGGDYDDMEFEMEEFDGELTGEGEVEIEVEVSQEEGGGDKGKSEEGSPAAQPEPATELKDSKATATAEAKESKAAGDNPTDQLAPAGDGGTS